MEKVYKLEDGHHSKVVKGFQSVVYEETQKMIAEIRDSGYNGKLKVDSEFNCGGNRRWITIVPVPE